MLSTSKKSWPSKPVETDKAKRKEAFKLIATGLAALGWEAVTEVKDDPEALDDGMVIGTPEYLSQFVDDLVVEEGPKLASSKKKKDSTKKA